MRKLFYCFQCLLCLVAVLLSSCKKNSESSVSGPQCWEITRKYNGMTSIFYEWCTEDSVKAFASAASANGMATTYKKAEAKDENSCYNLYVSRTWDEVLADHPFISSFPRYDYKMHNINYSKWSIFDEEYEELRFSEQRCDTSHYNNYKQKIERSGFTKTNNYFSGDYEQIIYELRNNNETLTIDVAYSENSLGCVLQRVTEID